MNELLPCPFCGGEPRWFWNGTVSVVRCMTCCASIDNNLSPTEDKEIRKAEAIAAWNTRVDYHGYEQAAIEAWESITAWNTRTDDYKRAAEYWQRMYEQTFAERTCHDTGENEWHFVCSACGYEQNGYEFWNYCPNCGRKVSA